MGDTGKEKRKKLFLFCFKSFLLSSIEYYEGVVWMKMKKVEFRWRD